MQGLPIGYYETPLTVGAENTYMCVWLPLKAPPTKKQDVYRVRMSVAKKISMITSGRLLLPCLPSTEAALPTCSPGLGTATSDHVVETLRGIVVVAHGLGDGPLVIAQVAEQLASAGFICASPSFCDAAASVAASAVTPPDALALSKIHEIRLQTMDACAAAVRSEFGTDLPLALVGYSLGADTIRHMACSCPRVYVAGPGFLDKMLSVSGDKSTCTERPASAPPPGPSMQVLASNDTAMTLIKLTLDETSEYTGYSVSTGRQVLAPEQLDDHAILKATHLRVDMPGFNHSYFKFAQFARMENWAWRRALCGLNPFDPCSNPPEPEVQEDRSRRGAEPIVRWLLATMPATSCQIDARAVHSKDTHLT